MSLSGLRTNDAFFLIAAWRRSRCAFSTFRLHKNKDASENDNNNVFQTNEFDYVVGWEPNVETTSLNADETTASSNGPTFGDIMHALSKSTSNNLLETKPTQDYDTFSSLADVFGITHPLDRMALTANGNLQRLVSSYYDAPVQVVVDRCSHIVDAVDWSAAEQVWERRVHLTVHNQTFCTAYSRVVIRDPLCQQLVASKQVGLGQLFRYLDILPEFDLHQAASKPEGGFWRDYTLQCNELSCRIHEDFIPDMWDLKQDDR